MLAKSSIDRKLAPDCDSEYCWIRRLRATNGELADTLAAAAFRPAAPVTWREKPNEWIRTMQIYDVMRQYEKEVHRYMAN